MTHPSRDDAAVPPWAPVWFGRAQAVQAFRTRSTALPRQAGHHLAGLGRRTDVDPDDQVPVLHWDELPDIDDAVPALPILVRAADATDPRHHVEADGAADLLPTSRPVVDGPAADAAGLPRQRASSADLMPAAESAVPAAESVPATSPSGRRAARRPAMHFHPPRMH